MINNQGKLEIPLYHGTSNLFLNSIIEHGLGGFRDPYLFDVNILALLAEALNVSKNKTEWWESNFFIVDAMLKQRVTDANFNFRYGGTYLSPSKSVACRYATGNYLGSEFLSTIYQAFMALNSVNPADAVRIIPKDHCLHTFFQKSHCPILITVTNIDSENLRTEQGECIDEQISKMIELKNEFSTVDPEVLFQQFNFELQSAIDSTYLSFTNIDKDLGY